jgi:hypothetical protein
MKRPRPVDDHIGALQRFQRAGTRHSFRMNFAADALARRLNS